MNIFHLHAEKEQGGTRDTGTWLVIADSLFDAISFVPEDFCVKAIEIQLAVAAGPGRVVGCFGAPTFH